MAIRWKSSLYTISTLLSLIEPRDLHAVAVQGVVFSDRSPAHVCLCLLLCAHAINSCPSTIDRWKRWRSILCETIALFQRYVLVTENDERNKDEANTLWLNHVLPACLHVERVLPPECHRIPIMAGIVSVSSHLVLYASADTRQRLLQSIRRSLSCNEDELWSHPWRVYEHREYDCHEDDDNDCKEYLWWWTIYANRDDSVAGMDTIWDPDGIAILAFLGYDQRPLVYTPTFQWFLWFPHTSTLLLNNDLLSCKDVFGVLQSLLVQLSSKSLEWSHQEDPSSPIGTLQLLLNQTAIPNTNDKPRVVSTIKLLLSKYTPESQVSVVSRLMETCPHFGVMPRLLDLLRPIVTTTVVANYLQTFVDKMLKQHLNSNNALENVEELVDQVEVYVSVLSMIQLRYMLLSNDDTTTTSRMEGLERLETFHNALTSTLQQDKDAHFRLNLLENALQQVVAVADQKR